MGVDYEMCTAFVGVEHEIELVQSSHLLAGDPCSGWDVTVLY